MARIGCVLLGAGSSVRMGEPKLLRRIGGRTIFEIALAISSRKCNIYAAKFVHVIRTELNDVPLGARIVVDSKSSVAAPARVFTE